jgi:2-keto-4-pentenoate hydratase/2-oxohepta-3-ene-1,7-dioic acid hydratase in catechol pathway
VKLVRYREGKILRFGEVVGDRVLPVRGDPLKGGAGRGRGVPLRSVRLAAPCAPTKVVAVAINYKEATGATAGMKEPLVFLKSPEGVIGPGEAIRCPFRGVRVWGEPEIAVVIGRRLSGASVRTARRGIFGYTIANDVSAHNVQGWDHHLARSKAADTFCPLGPWIDTRFEPGDHRIEGWHNDVLLRRGRAGDRLWKDAALIAWLSRWMTLNPWDVVLTGTPPRTRDRLFLREGDTFACEVEGLGRLENRFTRRIAGVA